MVGDEEHYQAALSLTWAISEHYSLQAIASRYWIADNVLRSSTTRPPSSTNGGAGNVSYGDGTGWRTIDAKLVGEFRAHSWRLGLHGDTYELNNRLFDVGDWRLETPRSATPNSVFAGKAQTLAFFVEDEWRLAERWTVVGGWRYERTGGYEANVRAREIAKCKIKRLAWLATRSACTYRYNLRGMFIM